MHSTLKTEMFQVVQPFIWYLDTSKIFHSCSPISKSMNLINIKIAFIFYISLEKSEIKKYSKQKKLSSVQHEKIGIIEYSNICKMLESRNKKHKKRESKFKKQFRLHTIF